jgi:oxygen-independent coproporphyrinogen-3 oxidase
VFSYAHVPWVKPAQKILEQKNPADARNKIAVAQDGHRATDGEQSLRLYWHGPFCSAETSWFRRNATRRCSEIFRATARAATRTSTPFGMSSISQIPGAYWRNEKDLPKYRRSRRGQVPLTPAISSADEDKVRRDTIMRVMCDLSLNYAAMSQRLGINFASHFERELESRRL